LPALGEFQKLHPDANFLSVDIAGKTEEAISFLAAHHLKTLRVAVTSGWPLEFGASGTPTTIVMDRFGQIQFVHAGQLADVGAILGKDLEALPVAR
jgi:predicted transcriptional regulator